MPKPPIYSASSQSLLIENPAYKKALEIFKISRGIARHSTDNKDILQMSSSNELSDLFSVKIVMHSLQLIEQIGLLKNDRGNSKYLRHIEYSISSLKMYCEKFELHTSMDRDIISLLKTEIETLKELFWRWALSSE
ncbi:hypothetical protein [Aquimarina sp. RZ0]|uniref:hypothetical protein n=1 Tax=Aquimarina sp. RZ0 TaxID=2607730 RepID=UPI0011F3B1E1|nr:hypothetical protein [Aquimarina sp. RZ0]KAA1246043.1 hypothetical protein F0000_09315 [Aquimarina sp. RZ0]